MILTCVSFFSDDRTCSVVCSRMGNACRWVTILVVLAVSLTAEVSGRSVSAPRYGQHLTVAQTTREDVETTQGPLEANAHVTREEQEDSGDPGKDGPFGIVTTEQPDVHFIGNTSAGCGVRPPDETANLLPHERESSAEDNEIPLGANGTDLDGENVAVHFIAVEKDKQSEEPIVILVTNMSDIIKKAYFVQDVDIQVLKGNTGDTEEGTTNSDSSTLGSNECDVRSQEPATIVLATTPDVRHTVTYVAGDEIQGEENASGVEDGGQDGRTMASTSVGHEAEPRKPVKIVLANLFDISKAVSFVQSDIETQLMANVSDTDEVMGATEDHTAYTLSDASVAYSMKPRQPSTVVLANLPNVNRSPVVVEVSEEAPYGGSVVIEPQAGVDLTSISPDSREDVVIESASDAVVVERTTEVYLTTSSCYSTDSVLCAERNSDVALKVNEEDLGETPKDKQLELVTGIGARDKQLELVTGIGARDKQLELVTGIGARDKQLELVTGIGARDKLLEIVTGIGAKDKQLELVTGIGARDKQLELVTGIGARDKQLELVKAIAAYAHVTADVADVGLLVVPAIDYDAEGYVPSVDADYYDVSEGDGDGFRARSLFNAPRRKRLKGRLINGRVRVSV